MTLLDGTGVSESIKMQSANAIQATAMHLEQDWDPDFNKIMDLDMAGFSSDKQYYDIQNNCIKKEFCQPDLKNYKGNSLNDFNKGRLSFLNSLKNKKSIYRTELFLNNFEQKAQENLINSIKNYVD